MTAEVCKTFSGYQPCQLVKIYGCFRNHLVLTIGDDFMKNRLTFVGIYDRPLWKYCSSLSRSNDNSKLRSGTNCKYLQTFRLVKFNFTHKIFSFGVIRFSDCGLVDKWKQLFFCDKANYVHLTFVPCQYFGAYLLATWTCVPQNIILRQNLNT
jgi:hypothetical protein